MIGTQGVKTVLTVGVGVGQEEEDIRCGSGEMQLCEEDCGTVKEGLEQIEALPGGVGGDKTV